MTTLASAHAAREGTWLCTCGEILPDSLAIAEHRGSLGERPFQAYESTGVRRSNCQGKITYQCRVHGDEEA